MPSARSKLGAQGEAVAAAHLESHGMRILDLVARDGDTVVFVEVKTRRNTNYGTPEESVTQRKRERLAKTAETYLQQRKIEQSDWRIDVVAITLQRDGPAEINHITGV